MGHSTRVLAALALCAAAGSRCPPLRDSRAPPKGQMVIGVHVTVAPRWLDPAETESAISPFLVLYAIHDALVKPMPAGPQTPCLAESWSVSPDGLTYDFVLRAGASSTTAIRSPPRT